MSDPTSDDAASPEAGNARSGEYEVLARKHRPLRFDTLIGQDSLVRTLRNAFETNRIAHAFMLTGIRGVGKTTTARIIARALNCAAAGAQETPSFNPCGVCDSCVSITESRHIDVVEIDAASHTGVDHARELIGQARHRPAEGRYRVFIVDEVHMLSRSAFNALLKTLEEPPPHAKFILATTEIRKVPVTVLSRCQRFDLRRIDSDVLMRHVEGIAVSEGAAVEPGALALIARAAEGSVRDAISLLDQALAHGDADKEVSASAVREMLALADNARVLDLFERIVRGDAPGALKEMALQFEAGADPVHVMETLAETCHFVSVLRVAPDLAKDPTLSEDERRRGAEFAERLTPPVLVRFWQILEHALEEIRRSERPRLGADMAILRLAYASGLPTPAELIARLEGREAPASAPAAADGSAGSPRAERPPSPPSPPSPPPSRASVDAPGAAPEIRTAEDLAELARSRQDYATLQLIEKEFRPAAFAERRIRFVPGPDAPANMAVRLRKFLERETRAAWSVEAVETGGGRTLQEIRDEESASLREKVMRHPEFLKFKAKFEDPTGPPGQAPSVVCYPDRESGRQAA